MIKVTFEACNGVIKNVCISGHSGYAEQGSDIVCAAVSSAAIMTFNTITEVMKLKADVTENDGYLKFCLSDQGAVKSAEILEGLKLHLLGLSEQYKTYIKVNFSEV